MNFIQFKDFNQFNDVCFVDKFLYKFSKYMILMIDKIKYSNDIT